MPKVSVAERVALVTLSTDRSVLADLAGDRSVSVALALFDRHIATGDVDDEWLDTALERHSGSRHLVDGAERACQARPLPLSAFLRLAHLRPKVLLNAPRDVAAAAGAAEDGDEAWQALLAWRACDVEGLKGILCDRDPNEPAWQELQDLLLTTPLPKELMGDALFVNTLLEVANRHDGSEEADNLRVVAAQSDEVVAQHKAAVLGGGRPLVTAAGVAESGMGPYGGRLSGPRAGAFCGAKRLWESVDMTLEQTLARSVVAETGSTFFVVETRSDTFVATPKALHAYPKTTTRSYTYVHLHLTDSSSTRFVHPSGAEVRALMPSVLPALKYYRERAPRPDDPGGPELESIVWEWPFTPAIYSASSTKFGIAVANGRVALTELP